MSGRETKNSGKQGESCPDSEATLFQLETMDAIFEVADDGLEAIEKAQKGAYDIILMDMQMPLVDGNQATRTHKSQGFDLPIVALTAHALVEERAASVNAGCSYHLTKPIDAIELIATIKNLTNG